MTEEVIHPLTDAAGDGWVATEFASPVVALTSGMSDFLHRAGIAGTRPLIVTGTHSRLTQPLFEVLSDLQGRWVVRTAADTFYDARTGVVVPTPDAALSLPRLPTREGSLASEFLARPVANSMRLVTSFSTRHRVSRPVRLGGPMEALSNELRGEAPLSWGATEPVTVAWDRDELTEYSRRRMPDDSIWSVVGDTDQPLVGTIRVGRTTEGLEETTHASLDLGAPGDRRQAAVAEDARRSLAAGARHGMPLLGLAFAHISAPDLARLPLAEPPVLPLALLIGPPGVRMLGVPPAAWVTEFGAALLGSPRVPAVLFALGTTAGGGWERVRDILSRPAAGLVDTAIGSAPRVAAQLRYAQEEGGAPDA